MNINHREEGYFLGIDIKGYATAGGRTFMIEFTR